MGDMSQLIQICGEIPKEIVALVNFKLEITRIVEKLKLLNSPIILYMDDLTELDSEVSGYISMMYTYVPPSSTTELTLMTEREEVYTEKEQVYTEREEESYATESYNEQVYPKREERKGRERKIKRENEEVNTESSHEEVYTESSHEEVYTESSQEEVYPESSKVE